MKVLYNIHNFRMLSKIWNCIFDYDLTKSEHLLCTKTLGIALHEVCSYLHTKLPRLKNKKSHIHPLLWNSLEKQKFLKPFTVFILTQHTLYNHTVIFIQS